jgi:hypothetical protein
MICLSPPCKQHFSYWQVTVFKLAILSLLFNLLAKPSACTTAVLFKFQCLIRQDDNTKGKENNFQTRQTQHTTWCRQTRMDSWTTWIISVNSEYNNQKPSCLWTKCKSVWTFTNLKKPTRCTETFTVWFQVLMAARIKMTCLLGCCTV